MIPGTYNLTIIRGDTWVFQISHKNSLGVYTDFEADFFNTPGAGQGGFRMHIRPAYIVKPDIPKATPLLILSSATGEISASGTVLTCTLTAAITASLEFNEGSYDLECFTGDVEPVVHKVLRGLVAVQDEKTG